MPLGVHLLRTRPQREGAGSKTALPDIPHQSGESAGNTVVGHVAWRRHITGATGEPLLNAQALTVHDGAAYLLSRGRLLSAPLGDLAAIPPAEPLFFDDVTPLDGTVEGWPIQELAYLAPCAGGGIYAMDKALNLFLFRPDLGWSVERPADTYRGDPTPLYTALAAYGGALYLLDSSHNQVWRLAELATSSVDAVYPGAATGTRPRLRPMEPLLQQVVPWEVELAEVPDVRRGISLAAGSHGLYVHTWDSDLLRITDAQEAPEFRPTLRPDSAEPASESSPGTAWSEGTHVILSDGPQPLLYVLQEDQIAIRDVEHGTLLVALRVPDAAEPLHGLSALDDHLLVLTGAELVALLHPDTDERAVSISTTSLSVPSRGQRAHTPIAGSDRAKASVVVPAPLQGFAMPIRGVQLPDRDGVLPGAARLYRYGVHEGIDFYEEAPNRLIQTGAPVFAAKDGRVVRADHGFVELLPPAYNAIIRRTAAQRYTNWEQEDALRGMQVWVEHEGGVVTRYAHLAGIESGIEVGARVEHGQHLGAVGNSGTSASVHRSTYGAHLHFEIRISTPGEENDRYLGQHLTLHQTRTLLQHILTPLD